jgi:(S)-3,5-dihydroxyphenylglycine transaminase
VFSLRLEELHGSLADPVLGSIGFLNEIMSRYPNAIPFAPGAPNRTFVDGFNPMPYIERFVRYAATTRGMGEDAARRLLYEYGPSRGVINDIIATAWSRDHAADIAPDAVVVTVGAQEAMLLTLRALFGRSGDQLAVSNPCFPGIVGAARLLGVDIATVDDGPDGLDLDQLRGACQLARNEGLRVRACYVAPDFANPTGTRMSVAAREELLALAVEADLVLLEDNAYGFTAATSDELPPLAAMDQHRVAHISTFAKIGVAGARVGFVIAAQPVCGEQATASVLADHLAALKSMVTVNTSPLCQAVIGGMVLAHGTSLRELGAAKSKLYRENLRLVLEALDRHLARDGRPPQGVNWDRPEGGFFVRVYLPFAADAALLEESASRYGVLWTPMSTFYLDGGGTNVLRLSCSYLDAEQIDTGVARLAELVRSRL